MVLVGLNPTNYISTDNVVCWFVQMFNGLLAETGAKNFF